MQLRIAATDAGPVKSIALGPDVLLGQAVQAVVPAGEWQAATASEGWALVSCIVAPGFDFAGFVLAPPGWEPAG